MAWESKDLEGYLIRKVAAKNEERNDFSFKPTSSAVHDSDEDQEGIEDNQNSEKCVVKMIHLPLLCASFV